MARLIENFRAGPKIDNALLGAAVASHRRAHGWSQTQLAARLANTLGRQYSQTTLSQWEQGRVDIPADAQSALLQLFPDLASDLPAVESVDDPREADDPASLLLATPATTVVRSENFELWRSCVGLDEAFPAFEVGGDPVLNTDRESDLRKLVDFTASKDGPSVVLTFATGHGITTFARYAFRVVHHSLLFRSAVLPVPVPLRDVVEQDGSLATRETLVERVRRRIVCSLAMLPREHRGRDEGIGALAERWDHDVLYAHHDDLPWDDPDLASPFKDLELAPLVQQVAGAYRLFPSLYIDVSSAQGQRMDAELRRLVGPSFEMLSALQLDVRESVGSTFSLVAFAPSDDELLLRQALVSSRGGHSNPEIVRIRPYAPFEVFKMLMNRYGDDLPTKVDPAILLRIVSPSIPLRRTEALLLQALLDRFGDLSGVAYAIGPLSRGRDA